MQTRVCCGLIGPDSMIEEDQLGYTTPDPETLRIMLAHDPYAELKPVGPSSWDLMSSEERRAMKEKRSETQRQPWVPPGGEAPPYAERREPISGALYEDTRVYTRKEGKDWKFWGVMEDGMSEEEFWIKHDPLNARERESPPPPAAESRHSSPPHNASRTKPSLSNQKPQSHANHKVRKSQTPSSPGKKSSRRSLGSTKDITSRTSLYEVQNNAISLLKENQGSGITPLKAGRNLQGESDTGRSKDTSGPARATRGRPRKDKSTRSTTEASHPVARAQAGNLDTSPKRPRGRPPKQILDKSAKEIGNKRTLAASARNGGVTKPRKTTKPSATSVHNMRTRARDQAERVQLP